MQLLKVVLFFGVLLSVACNKINFTGTDSPGAPIATVQPSPINSPVKPTSACTDSKCDITQIVGVTRCSSPTNCQTCINDVCKPVPPPTCSGPGCTPCTGSGCPCFGLQCTGSCGDKANPCPPQIPVTEVEEIELVLVHYAYEAWYRSCVSLGVANWSSNSVSFCNTHRPTTPLKLKVHRSECNILRMQVDVTKNTPKSCVQNSDKSWNCKYPNVIDWQRRTDNANDRRFFGIFDGTQVTSITSQEAFKYLIRPLEASSKNTSLAYPWNKAIRVYFEDHKDDMMSKYQAGAYLNAAEKNSNPTIDYDDLVFEIRGKKNNFTFEGNNYTWSPTGANQSADVVPPACH